MRGFNAHPVIVIRDEREPENEDEAAGYVIPATPEEEETFPPDDAR